jgi:hypothetical protein
MNTKTIKTYLLILLTFLFCAGLSAQDNFKLKYNYKKGQAYQYSTSMDMSTTVEMMGQEMKTGNVASAIFKFNVDKVEDNKDMVLIASVDSGFLKTHTPMKDTTISLNALSGKKTKYVVSELGKIKSREVIDTISDPILQGYTNQGAFRLYTLPENQIKMGETWNTQDSTTIDAMGGKIVNRTAINSTLAGTEEKLGYKCLKVTFTGDVKSEGNANIQGQKVFIEGTGKVSGTLFFDSAKGIIIYNESLTDMQMTMAVTGQQNMVIPLTQSVKSVLSIK